MKGRILTLYDFDGNGKTGGTPNKGGWMRCILKFEDNLVAYGITSKGKNSNNKTILAKGPHEEPMGNQNTFEISKSFVESIVDNNEKLRLNSFQNSINSLSAVLAANVSNDLGGERIEIDEFINSPKFSKYRTKNS